MTRRKRRWSDENRHFGPFTWSGPTYRKFGVVVDSGHGEEYNSGCHARIYIGKHCLLIELPNWIPDFRIKHMAESWDAETIARMGRNYYFETFSREYGFSFDGEGAVHTYFGPQTHDSLTTRGKVFFLPWTNWRFVGQRWYGLSGELLRADGPKYDETRYEFEKAMPKAVFLVDDFDGERIQASTHIEEREWKFGTGYFRWLSMFRRSKIRRDLNISFDKEVGPEKGSWKGGTVGHSIEMLPGETHESAFRRYCEKDHRSKHRQFKVTYAGPAQS